MALFFSFMRTPSFARVLFLTGLLVFTGVGCRGGGERPTSTVGDASATTTEPTPPEGMACSHEYYPLRAGYSIQYHTTYPASMGTSGGGNYALRVTRVTGTSAHMKAVFERSGGGAPIASDVEYKCISGGLYASGYVNMGGASPGGPAGNYEVQTVHSEGEFLPAHIRPGSVWQSSFTIMIIPPAGSDSLGSASRPVMMDVTAKRRAVGLVRVRVPAGEYEAMQIAASTAFDGQEAMTGTEWWVKDVGMVKSTYSASPSSAESIVTEATGVAVPR